MTPRVSDSAVRQATGRGWDGWFSLLGEAEGGDAILEVGHRDA